MVRWGYAQRSGLQRSGCYAQRVRAAQRVAAQRVLRAAGVTRSGLQRSVGVERSDLGGLTRGKGATG